MRTAEFATAGVVVLASAAAFGIVHVPNERSRAITKLSEDLSLRADVRKSSIQGWLQDGLADAGVPAAFPSVRQALEAGAPSKAHVQEVLTSFHMARGDVAVALLDRSAAVVAVSGPLDGVPAAIVDPVLVKGKGVAWFTRRDGAPRVDFIVPVRRATGEIRGALVLETDPGQWLYPFLAAPPMALASAEAVLLRRDGDSIVFLSPLRFDASPPMVLRRSLAASPNLAAVKALDGVEGVGEYRDYRGVPILAATRRIEGTDWGLVVKVDRSEALADFQSAMRYEAVVSGIAVLALVGVGLTILSAQRRRNETALASSQARLSALLDSANDAVLFVAGDGRILDVNRRAEQMYGVSRARLLSMRLEDLKPDAERSKAPADDTLSVRGSWVYETVHRHTSGAVFPVEVSARLAEEMVGGQAFLAIVRDISERKRTEARILQLNRLYQTTSEVSRLIVREREREALLQGVCRVLVEHGPFLLAWVALPDREGRRLRPAASAGKTDYLDGLAIELDDPAQRGRLSGGAYLKGELVLVQDLSAVDDAAPWKQGLLRIGMRSGSALPLKVSGAVAGVLTVYAAEPNAFDSEAVELLSDLAGDLGYAMEALEERERRERAEEAKARSDARLETLASATFEGIAFTDRGLVVDVNAQFVEMFGYSYEELKGKPVLDLVAPARRAEVAVEIRDNREGPLEDLAARKDGTTFPVEARTRTIMLGRRPIRVTAVRDISERKRAEDEQQRQRELLQKVFDNIPVLIVTRRADGGVGMVNAHWERSTGWVAADLSRSGDLAKRHPGANLGLVLQACDACDGQWREIAMGTRDGRTLHTRWASVRLSDGTIVGIGEDETDRRKIEAELLQAQKMEAVGRLAGGVAHDFNNVLGVILGYTELHQRELARDDPQLRKLEQVRKAAERAASLTRQLLAFSRKQVLQPRPLQLNDVVRDLEPMLRRLIGEDVQLTTSLASDLWRVVADEGQVHQVVMNLAVNARDAMPQGGTLVIETANDEPSVEYLEVHPEVAPGRYVALSVRDTGHGMTPETLAHIFEPFFTTKEAGKGTGLGLATVYGAVRQSGGYVDVATEVGKGATFRVCLPRAEAAAARASADDQPQSTAGGGETILLVEDDASLRSMIEEILTEAGYEVLPAADPQAALSVAREHRSRIHLLLSDVVMPGTSGPDLARAVAALLPDTPVLYMSGYTDEAIGRHGLLEPGIRLLQKPFTAADILRDVRAAIEGGRSGPS